MDALVYLLFAAFFAAVVVMLSRLTAEELPPLGIVLLLSRAKTLQASILAEHFEQATKSRFQVVGATSGQAMTASDLPEGDSVLDASPGLLVKLNGDVFQVNSFAKPYEIDVESVREIDNITRAGEVLQAHRAWLSVEMLKPETVSDENYQIVAQVIGNLMSSECLAVLYPHSRKLILKESKTSLEPTVEEPIHEGFSQAHGLR